MHKDLLRSWTLGLSITLGGEVQLPKWEVWLPIWEVPILWTLAKGFSHTSRTIGGWILRYFIEIMFEAVFKWPISSHYDGVLAIRVSDLLPRRGIKVFPSTWVPFISSILELVQPSIRTDGGCSGKHLPEFYNYAVSDFSLGWDGSVTLSWWWHP